MGDPDATLRGYKLYTHRGRIDPRSLKEDNPVLLENNVVKPGSTQHTRLKPVNSGVRFQFRVYFENLSRIELGALLWTLQPNGAIDQTYCHKIGMAKSLGLGSVHLNRVTLTLTDRKSRYATLLDGAEWHTGAAASRDDPAVFRQEFEAHLIRELAPSPPCAALSQIQRIAILLEMMRWEDAPNAYRKAISENLTLDDEPKNRFKNRAILPHPLTNDAMKGLSIVAPLSKSSAVGPMTTAPPQTLEQLRAAIPASAPQEPKKNMEATYLEEGKPGKHYVKLEGLAERILCEGVPLSITPKRGDVVPVEVEYDKRGVPVKTKFKTKR